MSTHSSRQPLLADTPARLFDDLDEGLPPGREPLLPGAVVLRGFARTQATDRINP